MMTWRRAAIEEGCGSCGESIRVGEIELLIDNIAGRRVRCAACGSRLLNEPAPTVLPDDEDADHEPSLQSLAQPPAGQPMVSVGELARRRAANHFRQRGRR